MAEQEKPRPMTLADWERIQSGIAEGQRKREEMLLSLGRELQVDRSEWPVMYPLKTDGETDWGTSEWLSVPISELPFMAQSYINMVETERTNRLCKCEWIVHPDDTDKEVGTRRVHKGREHAQCPVHTKLGFLLYFFVHYFKTECAHCPPDCKSCLFTVDCECYEHQPDDYIDATDAPVSKTFTMDNRNSTYTPVKVIDEYPQEYSVTDPEGA